MNALDTNRININSPYKVWTEGQVLHFLRWFNGYEQQQKYVIRAAEVPGINPDGKPTKEYVAIIVPRTHPQMQAIINLFDEEIAMFCANKPQG